MPHLKNWTRFAASVIVELKIKENPDALGIPHPAGAGKEKSTDFNETWS